MGHRLNQTVLNPRWWLALPAMFLIALLSFVLTAILRKPLWALGQAICRFSGRDVMTAKQFRSFANWVRAGARNDAQEEVEES